MNSGESSRVAQRSCPPRRVTCLAGPVSSRGGTSQGGDHQGGAGAHVVARRVPADAAAEGDGNRGAMDGAAHDAAGCLDGTDWVAMEADRRQRRRHTDETRTKRNGLNRQRASGGHTGGTKCPAAVADE